MEVITISDVKILAKLRDLKTALSIPISSDKERSALIDQARLIFEKRYGKNHFFLTKCVAIQDGFYLDGKSQRMDMVNLIQLVITDLELEPDAPDSKPEPAAPKHLTPIEFGSVFVVHGRDDEMKHSVARAIEALGLRPIILHEQADKGRTIIEKFHEYSSVGFAVVLLSPDDVGRLRGTPVERERPRPRQNVLFELGFFLGKLSRSRVLAFVRQIPEFELPSDYAGVLLKTFDEAGNWRFELCRELREAGYKVDANKLLA